MTALARTVALLAEINPPVAAAVRAIGPNAEGWPLPGLLGWLPETDRLDLGQAVGIAHQDTAWPPGYSFDATPQQLAADIVVSYWSGPRGHPGDSERIRAAIGAYLDARAAR